MKRYDDIAFALRNISIDEDTIKIRIEGALKAVKALDSYLRLFSVYKCIYTCYNVCILQIL